MDRIRGWMIDAARLPEPMEHYRRVVDECAAAGLNAILFRLTDDQGTALRFESHPELDAHPHAYNPSELADLAAYARGKGVDLIPEIESFGHTGFITRSPIHQHLLDEDPEQHAHFTGIIPQHPDSLALLADLYREISAIFPSPYLHAGCDEVNWGSSPYSQRLINTRGRPAVWAGHINLLNELARQNKRQLMIWADHPLYSSPEILPLLDRQIILVDWNYWETDPQVVRQRLETALQAGFRILGAPAWIWCRWSVRPGESQLQNIDAFSAAYTREKDPDCLGMLVTNWVPSRWLNGAVWDGPAYTAFRTGPNAAADRTVGFRAFVEKHYLSAWSDEWAGLYARLFDCIPPRKACAGQLPGPFQPELWTDPDGLRRCLEQNPADPSPLQELLHWAHRCELQVSANHADFLALLRSLEFLVHLHVRSQAVQQVAGRSPAEYSQIAGVMNLVAAADAGLAAELQDDWNQTRFPNDPAMDSLLSRLGEEDQVLFTMRRGADFSQQLAKKPTGFPLS